MDSVKPFRDLITAVDGLEEWAGKDCKCRRKAVGAEAFYITERYGVQSRSRHCNGPTTGWVCTNEQGNCGCAHAEPKVVLDVLRWGAHRQHKSLSVLGCAYSPCARCAHVIIESRLFDACVFKTLTLHDTRGRDLLEKSGIACFDLNDLRIALEPISECPVKNDIKEKFNVLLSERWADGGSHR